MLVFFDILRESRKSFLRDWHCLAWSASTPAPCHKMHFNCKILDSTMYIWYIFYLSLHPGTSETERYKRYSHCMSTCHRSLWNSEWRSRNSKWPIIVFAVRSLGVAHAQYLSLFKPSFVFFKLSIEPQTPPFHFLVFYSSTYNKQIVKAARLGPWLST